jgi:hypothetical protein
LDQLTVNKLINLRQRVAISAIVYDSLNEILWVGSVDGRITTITPDGLMLQNEPAGEDCSIRSIGLDHTVGLIWTIFSNGVLKLLDEHNMAVDLTSYFAALRELPIIGVKHHHWFGCHSDRLTREMLIFCNDHYIFEYEFDEAAAILTFTVPSPMRAVSLFEMTDTESPSDDLPRATKHAALGHGTFIINGCSELQIMEHSTR